MGLGGEVRLSYEMLTHRRRAPRPDGLSIDFKIRTANNNFWNVNLQTLFWKKSIFGYVMK